MQSFMYTVKTPVGLHARHAGLIVKEAKLYQSAITVTHGARSADARHLMALEAVGRGRAEHLFAHGSSTPVVIVGHEG